MDTVTSYFKIDPAAFHNGGALDVPLEGEDAHVYLDPRLLRRSTQVEFNGAMEDVKDRYARALALVAAANNYEGLARTRARDAAERLFRAPELDGLRIGHAEKGGKGRGIGPKKAAQMLRLADILISDGFEDPLLFELFSVVEKGIGADLISDLIADAIKNRLLAFSERIGREFGISTRPFETEDRIYHVPWNPLTDEPLILPPRDSVADLVAFGKSRHFDSKAFDNEGIRDAFDQIVKEPGLIGIRRFLQQHRDQAGALVNMYVQSAPAEHDVYKDKGGQELAGQQVFDTVSKKHGITGIPPETSQQLFLEVMTLCKYFKEEVEAGTFRSMLHSATGPRNEKMVQGIFRSFISRACKEMDVKVSPESDAGAGPADFVFDRGASIAIVLEVKLSSSPKLLNNYTYQVEAYKKSHHASHGIFMVLDLANKATAIEQLARLHDSLYQDARRPCLVVIDGRESASASKRKVERQPITENRTQPCLHGIGIVPARIAVSP